MESLGTKAIFFRFFEDYLSLGHNVANLAECHAGVAQVASVLVLTPNDRLATRLQNAFNDWIQAAGAQCWVSPTFISLSRWARDQWRTCRFYLDAHHPWADCVQLLDTQSEAVLWSVVLETTAELNLLDHRGLATQAQEAYRIQRGWQMKDSELQAHATGDQVHFVGWQAAFVRLCREQCLLPAADLIGLLAEVRRPQGVPRWSQCFWLGFSEPMPAELALFDHMPAAWGVTPERVSLRDCLSSHDATGAVVGGSFVFGALDEVEQMAQAVNWLLGHYRPDAKLALVVPDLPTRRTALEAEFRHVWGKALAPQALLELSDANIPDSTLAGWANFSGGQSLWQLPLFRPVVTLAEMSLGEVTQAHVLSLLQNPYVSQDTPEHLAAFAAELGAMQTDRWPLGQALEHWRALGMLERCPAWARAFENTVQVFVAASVLSPEVLQEALACWGWPGPKTLDSVEFQQFQKWPTIVSQWSSVLALRTQVQSQAVDSGTSVRELLVLLENQLFQPQSADTPLQVLGILEALEQPFDALWFLGAHDEALPPPARPHPLLPLSLQRHYNSLRATPARELALAQEVVSAFTALCTHTCFSWAEREGARVFAPSPLIAHLPPLAVGAAKPPLWREAPMAVTLYEQSHAKPIVEPQRLRGGTALLKTFAQCPFKAFVRFRLGLDAPQEPRQIGLSPIDRGTLVHAVLEGLWQVLKDQATLQALSPLEVQARVRTQVAAVLGAELEAEGLFLANMILPVEQQRLERLTLSWLSYEALRAPFSIRSIEQSLTLALEGLPLTVRLDRVDELQDGSLLVLDYKTGAVDIGQWFGRRIQEPQLPLYCTALQAGVKGVAFAVVRADKPQLKGLVSAGTALMTEDKHARSITPIEDWPEQLGRWSETLQGAAKHFLQGYAAIDPIEGARTCERCQFSSVCRIRSRLPSEPIAAMPAAEHPLAEV